MSKKKLKVTKLSAILPAVTVPAIGQSKAGSGVTKPTIGLAPLAKIPTHPEHRGAPVKVGPYQILAAGTRDLEAEDLEQVDLLVPLLNEGFPPMFFGKRYNILAAPLPDYGGVPTNWREFLEVIIQELKAGKRVLAFCMGSHGRTGTFLASLVALLEPEIEDPIATVRERHCSRAVESLTQAQAIFALRGEVLPHKYQQEFTSKVSAGLIAKSSLFGKYPSEK